MRQYFMTIDTAHGSAPEREAQGQGSRSFLIVLLPRHATLHGARYCIYVIVNVNITGKGQVQVQEWSPAHARRQCGGDETACFCFESDPYPDDTVKKNRNRRCSL
jgi:hypothetical protein